MILKKYLKYSAILFGAAAGYAYYYFVGCQSGSCPIQSNPYFSVLYGALLGALLIMPGKRKKKNPAD
jgi:phage shock protein E